MTNHYFLKMFEIISIAFRFTKVQSSGPRKLVCNLVSSRPVGITSYSYRAYQQFLLLAFQSAKIRTSAPTVNAFARA